MIHVWSTRLFEHAIIAHAANLWAFEVDGWRSGVITNLDKQVARLMISDIVVLYCSDKQGQGIVMLGHVSGVPLPGTDILGLWDGRFHSQVPIKWWNSPHVISKNDLKRELPLIRRKGSTANWQLYLGTNPLSFARPRHGDEFKLNIHDIFYLLKRLPVDMNIEIVSTLYGLTSIVPVEIYGPFREDQRAPMRKRKKDVPDYVWIEEKHPAQSMVE